MRKGRRVGSLVFIPALLWLVCTIPAGSRQEIGREENGPRQETARRLYESLNVQLQTGYPETVELPLIKEDRAGRAWAAWEELRNGRGGIGIGRLEKDGRLVPLLRAAPEGSNFSPDIAFGPDDSPWAVWGNLAAERYSLYVQDIASRRRWRLYPAQTASLTDPGIVCDGSGFIRVFWNETRSMSWQIVSRVFDGQIWSPRREVMPPAPVPVTNPDVEADKKGAVWLVWSGFDGRDYEIFITKTGAKGWSVPVSLTDNNENDLFPSLAIGQDDRPVICWQRSSASENQLFAATYAENGPFPEAAASPPLPRGGLFRSVSREGKISIVWSTAAGLGTKQISPWAGAELEGSPAHLASPPPLFNPDRDEDAYVGFGDSITYGYIDRLPAPELGYPPRLDAILDGSFGPTEMINEGLGAEKTPEGLIRIDAVLASHAARYILIMEGTNDVINKQISMDTSVFNIREMARKSLEAGAFPTITTIIPRRDWAWPDPQVRARQAYLNEQVRLLPAELHVSFIDMDLLFLEYPAENGGLLSLLSGDLKHPSEKGYQFMAEAWFNEIRNYPFPPLDLQLVKKLPRREAPEEPRTSRLRVPGRHRPAVRRKAGNFLSWKASPKIFDPARIKGYKVYRALKDAPGDDFSFLAFVSATPGFFDPGFQVFDRYTYLVSTLRDDDVEGPCSGQIDP